MTNRQNAKKTAFIQLLTVSWFLSTSQGAIAATVAAPLPPREVFREASCTNTAMLGHLLREVVQRRSFALPSSAAIPDSTTRSAPIPIVSPPIPVAASAPIPMKRAALFPSAKDFQPADETDGEISGSESYGLSPHDSGEDSDTDERQHSLASTFFLGKVLPPPAVATKELTKPLGALRLRRSYSNPDFSASGVALTGDGLIFRTGFAPKIVGPFPVAVPTRFVVGSAPSAPGSLSERLAAEEATRGPLRFDLGALAPYSEPGKRRAEWSSLDKIPLEVGALSASGLLLHELMAVEGGLVLAQDVTLSPTTRVSVTRLGESAFSDFSHQVKTRQLSSLLAALATKLETSGETLPSRALHLQSGSLDERGLLNLSKILNHMPNLTSLTIASEWQEGTFSEGADSVARSLMTLRHLKKLRLENTAADPVVSEGGPSLAEVTSKLLQGLDGKEMEELSLVNMLQLNPVQSDELQVEHMVDAMRYLPIGNGLRFLNLAGSHFGGGVAQALAHRLREAPLLEVLNLSNCDAGEYSIESGSEGFLPVVSALSALTNLKELRLDGMDPGSAVEESWDTRALRDQISRTGMGMDLPLQFSHGGTRAVVQHKTPFSELLAFLPKTSLETLSLRGITLNTAHAEKLLRALPWHSLVKVDFGGNTKGDTSLLSQFGSTSSQDPAVSVRKILNEVSRKGQGKDLEVLDLSAMRISETDATAIVTLCSDVFEDLRVLKLNSWAFESKGKETFKASLQRLVEAEGLSDGRARYDLIFIELPC